jgi:transcription-repair coupling factor (superfamily II helicase)
MQILDEAVGELKESELSGVIADVLPVQKTESKKKRELTIESDISMYIPEGYIDDENIRLEIYQRLSNVNSFEELNLIKEELLDRFGKITEEIESLFKHLEIKLMLSEKGFEKIVISGDAVELFVDLKNEEFFSGGYFERIVSYLNSTLSHKSRLNQTKKSLSIRLTLTEYNPLAKLDEIYNYIKILAEL